MNELKCLICQKTFRDRFNLRRHQSRSTSCAPIVDSGGEGNNCRFCGKGFASKPSMNRHVRQYCKIANSEEGMDKLMEHTLQRQIATQTAKVDALQAQLAAQSTQVTELATLLKQQLTLTARPAETGTEAAAQVNTGPVTNVAGNVNNTQNTQVTQVTQVTQNIIIPWDGERRIAVDVAQIAAAFAENTRLREYLSYGDHELVDPSIAPPYVTELLMDLVKRGHSNPSARNVYLNPRRADQVLVHMRSGKWEVMPLAEATRLLFDGVAATIHKIALSRAEMKELPLEAQNALAMAGMLYDEEPEEYAKRAKGQMAAHLTNMAPSQQ